jgi:hypothetical protein
MKEGVGKAYFFCYSLFHYVRFDSAHIDGFDIATVPLL